MIRNDSALKISPVRIGIVSTRIMQPEYMPRRLPPMTCPSMNCQSGVGETMTWSNAFSYSRCTLIFCATALKLPVIVDSETMPGIRKFRYGSPWEVVWIPSPNTIRYISGVMTAASVIL